MRILVESGVIKVKAAEFKTKCLELVDEVGEQAQTVVITKEGIPVGKLVPYVDRPDTLFGFLRDSVTIKGDIISPILPIGKQK